MTTAPPAVLVSFYDVLRTYCSDEGSRIADAVEQVRHAAERLRRR